MYCVEAKMQCNGVFRNDSWWDKIHISSSCRLVLNLSFRTKTINYGQRLPPSPDSILLIEFNMYALTGLLEVTISFSSIMILICSWTLCLLKLYEHLVCLLLPICVVLRRLAMLKFAPLSSLVYLTIPRSPVTRLINRLFEWKL